MPTSVYPHTQIQVQIRVGPLTSRIWCWGVIISGVYCKLCPECVWKPREAEKDIRALRDNSRTAAETKRGSVTAEGCFIRMRGSIIHLHKGQWTLRVNFPWHTATNFRAESFYIAITPIHPSLTHTSLPFLLTEREPSHWLRISCEKKKHSVRLLFP